MKAKKILIIEDEKDIREIYSLKLRKSKFDVIEAFDASEALKILKKQLPDLILLDLVMPQMSGYEFLKEIGRVKKYKNIPVFILSNLDQELEVKEGLRLKADKYFIKANYSPADIVIKVKEYFAQK